MPDGRRQVAAVRARTRPWVAESREL